MRLKSCARWNDRLAEKLSKGRLMLGRSSFELFDFPLKLSFSLL
jgi:hypothetical protein